MPKKETTKNLFFNHVVITGNNDVCYAPSFLDVLEFISKLPCNERILTFGNVRTKCSVEHRSYYWVITLQNLKNDELPRIADAEDGNNERNLNMPDGGALSYKNVFVYCPDDNFIRYIKPYSCPQIGKLRACINRLIRIDNNFGDIRVDFGVVARKDVCETLRAAKVISSAMFTSCDYDGANIKETNLYAFKEYLGGKGIKKKTKITGVRGENLKGVLSGVIESILTDVDVLDYIDVEMVIDGKNVNFKKYYYTADIEVGYLGDGKTIDFDAMTNRMAEIKCEQL